MQDLFSCAILRIY